jgi:hypothetical protein
MPRPRSCADHLILLGEMLDAACQYLKLCDSGMNEEDQDMIALAYDQINPLSKRSAQLSDELDGFAKRVGKKLLRTRNQCSAPRVKSRSAGAGV